MDSTIPLRTSDIDRLVHRMSAIDLADDDRAALTALAAWARAIAAAREAAERAGVVAGARLPASTIGNVADRFSAAFSLGPSASVRGVPHSR